MLRVALNNNLFLLQVLDINVSIVHMQYTLFDMSILEKNGYTVILTIEINPTKWRLGLNRIASQHDFVC